MRQPLLYLVALGGIVSTAVGCGSPKVHSGSVDGGDAPGTFVTDQDGAVIQGDGLGTSTNGGEGPGVAPSCTNVDVSKVTPTDLVPIPAGDFTMGCNAAVDQECREDEKPAHTVTLHDYSIDKTEVTEAQYFACVAAGKCTYPKCPWDPCARGNYPIGCVTRPQADAYCAFVQKRLPTEAEWEKSARGTDGRKYPWGNGPISCFLANIEGCAKDLEPVGKHPENASPYGVLDLAGNVVEWTKDFYDPNYYATSPPADPPGPPQAPEYVGRGGGFLSEAVWQRTSSRDSYPVHYTRISLGIRCAK